MTMLKPTYDPNNPRDISDFLMVLGQMWFDLDDGPGKVKRAVEEAAKTGDGKQLLLNCHLVVSRQIPQTRDTKMLYMLKSFQQMTGALAQGGY